MNRKMRGFTLVELMVVVVVLAVLASIAVPSYRTYLLRSHRSEAMTALLQLRSAQERFFLQNGTYATTTAQLTQVQPGGLGLVATTPNGYYQISLAAGATATTYTAQAVPLNGQTNDSHCQQFNITEQGARTSTPDATGCWR